MSTGSIEEKRRALQEYLHKVIKNQRRRSNNNHWAGILLMALAIAASAFAGIAGLVGKLDSRIVGGVALVPGFVALLGTTLKFDTRAMWHFRKKRAMQRLLWKLDNELPEVLSQEDLAAFSREFGAISEEIDSVYEREFTLSWGLAGTKPSKSQAHEGPKI